MKGKQDPATNGLITHIRLFNQLAHKLKTLQLNPRPTVLISPPKITPKITLGKKLQSPLPEEYEGNNF